MTSEGLEQLCCAVGDASQVGEARRVAARLARAAALGETDAGRLAIVVVELANNQLRHAGGGSMLMRVVERERDAGVEILAIDRGRGFDIARGLVDGYSTAGTSGTGLGAVRRMSSVFDAWSDARGSVLLSRVFPTASAGDPGWGVVNRPVAGEVQCGDGWAVRRSGGLLHALVVDGLGHGPSAADAARAGIAAFRSQAAADPAHALENLHRGMGGTRGGAAAVATVDPGARRLAMAGIGNIGVTLWSEGRARGLPSHSGIVGQGAVRPRRVVDAGWTAPALLVMASDGLQSRLAFGDYPGLVNVHPAVVAGLLFRDFERGNDDATVLVLPLA
nr:ATP-binding protein [Coralloluteibacterium stylophorae]